MNLKKHTLGLLSGVVIGSIAVFSAETCRRHIEYSDRFHKAKALVEQLADKDNSGGPLSDAEKLSMRVTMDIGYDLNKKIELIDYEVYLEKYGWKWDPRCEEYLRIRG